MTESVFEALWPKVDERWRLFSKEDLSLWNSLLQVLPGPMNSIQNLLFLLIQLIFANASFGNIAELLGDSCFILIDTL